MACGRRRRRGTPGEFLGLARLQEIPHDAVQKTQIIIELLIPIKLRRFLWRKRTGLLLAQQCGNAPLYSSRGMEDGQPLLKVKPHRSFQGQGSWEMM
jgi:hypothetical protein